MSSKTTSIAIPIQNGQRTHSQDQEATGSIDNSLKMTKTIPMTVRQPKPLDAVDFVDIHFSFFVVKYIILKFSPFVNFRRRKECNCHQSSKCHWPAREQAQSNY